MTQQFHHRVHMTQQFHHRYREKHNSKRHMHPSVHCSTVYNNQDMEATQMSIDRGIDKKRCSTYIQWNITQS